VSALAGNNYPTITSIVRKWYVAFQNTIFLPAGVTAGEAYTRVAIDIAAKELAGFPTTLSDVYGRLLSYQLFNGANGGVGTTLSGITADSNFSSHNAPYPIITALGVRPDRLEQGLWMCINGFNDSVQYEFHPYESGSWDSNVRAFTPTRYLGSPLNDGVPLSSSACMTGYDNLGFLAAASSNVFNFFCASIPAVNYLMGGVFGDLLNTCIAMLGVLQTTTYYDEYAVLPNPWFNSTLVPASLSTAQDLYLLDGSQGDASVTVGQTVPLWPLIQPERAVDVIIANDNSADTPDNWPNGSSVYDTYRKAEAAGLRRMPFIPSPDVFVSQGLNKRPVFFGCRDPSAATIIYLPNVNYTYQSNFPTFELAYNSSQVTGMVGNGNAMVTQNGTIGWPECVACGLMLKMNNGTLPLRCARCITEYCWNEANSTMPGNGPLARRHGSYMAGHKVW